MIIGVDAGCLSSKDKKIQAGVYQVVVNFLKELQNQDKKNTYYLYSFAKIDKNLLKQFGPRVKNVVVKPSRGWTKIWLPLRLLKDRPDIFLGLNQTLPIKLPFQTYKSILLVHDILFDFHPSFYADARRLHFETQFALRQADVIIAVSFAVKKDLINTYGIVSKKIKVAYEGVRVFPKQSSLKNDKMLLHKPYFLFVGAMKKSKNVPRIIEAFGKFAKENADYHLNLVGSEKWLDPKIHSAIKFQEKSIQKRIHKIDYIDDMTLIKYYKNASVFLSPSLYEGFGLPYVEAMQFGLPIISSSVGAIPEVVGNAGLLVSPTAIKEIVEAMRKITKDEKVYKKFSQASVKQSKKFSWAHFSHTIYSIITSYEDSTR